MGDRRDNIKARQRMNMNDWSDVVRKSKMMGMFTASKKLTSDAVKAFMDAMYKLTGASVYPGVSRYDPDSHYGSPLRIGWHRSLKPEERMTMTLFDMGVF